MMHHVPAALLAFLAIEACATEPAIPLSARGEANLAAYARLLGYVRWFHPSDEVMSADWHRLAIEGVQTIESAKDTGELSQRLRQLFQPLAPTLAVFPSDKPPSAKYVPDGDAAKHRLLIRRHLSVPVRGDPNAFKNTRVEAKDALPKLKAKEKIVLPDPAKAETIELGGGVSCRLPLALYADDKGTLPRGDAMLVAKRLAKLDSETTTSDRATRLAIVILAWIEAQHFFPYFDVIDTDWPAELKKALARAATDADDNAFLSTMRRMTAALHDGHAGVRSPALMPGYFPPIRWDWIEDRLLIVRVAKDAPGGFEVGDTVTAINGSPAVDALKKRAEEISGATPHFLRRAAMTGLALGKKGTTIEIEVEGQDGKKRKTKFERILTLDEYRALQSEPRPEPISEVRRGIWYLDLDRAGSKAFQEAVPKLAEARGLIVDLRGYPRFTHSLTEPLDFLCDKPLAGPPIWLPFWVFPDRRDAAFFAGRSLDVMPKKPHFQAKVVFLTDARAISAAETFLSIVQQHKLGAIVGQPTAGTNGNVRYVPLPAGYEVMFTGLKVLNYDGSTFHGKGVRPDVEVKRTIKGVLANKDEVLERGIEVVR